MGQTAIPYVDYTFSPWHGCAEADEGCDHCFARAIDKRFSGGRAWGAQAERRSQEEGYWAQPLFWDRTAVRRGAPATVLCGTMCDVCDPRSDLLPLRAQLEELMGATPHLWWLLLSKRPHLYSLFTEAARTLPNVLLGMTCVTQDRLDERAPSLFAHRATGYWLSVEPILGPVTLGPLADRFELVVCGDEDGPGRRPAELAWARRLRDDCAGRTRFFLKQWHFDNTKTNCPLLDGERHVETI